LEELSDEMLEIADDSSSDYIVVDGRKTVDHEHIQRAKLRIESRRWTLSKLAPKKFGERSALEISGPNGGPIRVLRELTDTERAARIQAIFDSAARIRDSGLDLV
jgi:hypothetical protein